MIRFYGEELLAPRPNPQAGGPLLVICLLLLTQYISSFPTYWRTFLDPQPEDAPCHGDRDPHLSVVITHNTGILFIHFIYVVRWFIWNKHWAPVQHWPVGLVGFTETAVKEHHWRSVDRFVTRCLFRTKWKTDLWSRDPARIDPLIKVSLRPVRPETVERFNVTHETVSSFCCLESLLLVMKAELILLTF
jgi:hypothetical protein